MLLFPLPSDHGTWKGRGSAPLWKEGRDSGAMNVYLSKRYMSIGLLLCFLVDLPHVYVEKIGISLQVLEVLFFYYYYI